MNRAMQLKLIVPADRFADLRKVSKLVARAMTFAMQNHRGRRRQADDGA
jgi:hypothetical protein